MVSQSLRVEVSLPRPRTPFVGREHDVRTVCALLTEANVPLVTLTGSGGVGKTRLSLEIAATVAGAYADGVAFVPLATVTDPAQVLPAIAQSVGVAEQAGRAIAELLVASLRPRQQLLILDNLEQVAGCAPALADLLAACPAVQILATSRSPLHLRDEREFPVSPLALPSRPRRGEETPSLVAIARSDAVKLFVARAESVSPGFALTDANAATLAEVCRRVDGLPLAIELAAARIKILSPDALLALLSRSLKLLTAGPRDLPVRHQTMRNTVAWSDDLLDEPARILLRRLGIFAGGCTLAAATAVANGDVYDVLDALTALVDQSLLRRVDRTAAGPRFEMLETIREYAVERLAATGEEEPCRYRHAAWCLAMAEEAATAITGPEQAAALARLDADHDNLRAALAWELDRGDPGNALRLAVALGRFWFIRGHAGEGHDWLARSLAAATGAPVALRATASNAIGALAHGRGDDAGAVAGFTGALALFREAGDRRGAGNALNNLGILAWYAADFPRAERLHGEALALFRDLVDRDGIATSLNALGNVVHHRGDYARAASLHAESVDLYSALRDDHSRAIAAISLGISLVEGGEPDHAAAVYAGTLTLCRELGFREGIAACLNNLGDLARLAGDAEKATALYEESLVLFRELENRRGIAVSLRNLGLLARDRGDRAGAISLVREALQLRSELGDRDGIAEGLEDLAALAAFDQPERAVRLYAAADRLRTTIDAPVRASERADRDRSLGAARNRLDAATHARAWSSGRALSPEDAVAEALSPTRAAPGTVKPAPPERPAHPLSRRELEVLRLLTERLSDKEIADSLSISPRTVMAHVASIFNKLAVNDRRAAAAYALRHGLV